MAGRPSNLEEGGGGGSRASDPPTILNSKAWISPPHFTTPFLKTRPGPDRFGQQGIPWTDPLPALLGPTAQRPSHRQGLATKKFNATDI